MRHVIRITYDNGDTMTTEVNSNVSKETITTYYLNSNPQDYDLQYPERLRKPVKVDFLN